MDVIRNMNAENPHYVKLRDLVEDSVRGKPGLDSKDSDKIAAYVMAAIWPEIEQMIWDTHYGR